MATRTAAPAANAVVPQPLSNEEFMALLGQTGMLASGGGEFHRMTLRAGMLVTDANTPQEEQWPPTDRGRGPAFLARIVKPPTYFNTFFCAEDEKNGAFDARKIGRGDLNGKFVKKYDDPADQAADPYANLEGYEAVSSYLGTRGQFKGDILLQIVPEGGQLTGEEEIYTLTLGTTSALDFRGTSNNPQGGIVQDKNFIVQLGEFAMKKTLEENPNASKGDLQKAVLDAMTALRIGNVVAAVYIRQASNAQNGNTWSVISFQPVHVELGGELPALPDPVATGPEQNGDDIPF